MPFLRAKFRLICTHFLNTEREATTSEIISDGKKMVACDCGLHYPRGQYRLQLLWYERVLPFLRAGVRLEPDGNLGRVLAGADRVRHFGSYRRLPDRPRWCPKNALHRSGHVLPRFFCSQLR